MKNFKKKSLEKAFIYNSIKHINQKIEVSNKS